LDSVNSADLSKNAPNRTEVNDMEAIIITKDLAGRYTFANSKALEHFEKSLPEVLGQDDNSLFDPEMAEKLSGNDFRVLAHGESIEAREQLHFGNPKQARAYLITKIPLRDAAGNITGLLGVYVERTGYVQDSDEQRIASGIFHGAQEGILIATAEGTIVDVNGTFERMCGYKRAELVGRNPRILNSGRQDRAFYEAMWQDLTTKGHWSGEIWNRRKSGEVYAVLQSIGAVYGDNGQVQYYIAHGADITTNKNHQVEIARVTNYDVLTKLPNRVLLSDRIRQKLAHARRTNETVAVVVLDLDDFKEINEEHGLHAGDEILIQVANRMQAMVRIDDTIARLGGDEFVLLLGDVSSRAACDQKPQRLTGRGRGPRRLSTIRSPPLTPNFGS